MNIQPGQVVRIINRDGRGEFFLEGEATVIRILPNFERNQRAMVSFQGIDLELEDPVERYIDIGAQGTDEELTTCISEMNKDFPW